jgi:hypothetical protein
MDRFRNLVAPVAQLATLVAFVAVVVLWGFKLEQRVGKLETLVQALVTSPLGYDPTTAKSAPSSTSSSDSPNRPLSATCATLAERAASAMTTTYSGGASEIKKLMVDLGCMAKN